MTKQKPRGSAASTLEKRLASYGSMSIAIAAAAVAPGAQASLIQYGFNITTPTGGGIIFNVTTGVATTVSHAQLVDSSLFPGTTPGNFGLLNSIASNAKKAWFIASSMGSNKVEVAPNAHQPAYSSVARITQNTVVGPTKTFKNGFGSRILAGNSSGSLALGNWKALGTAFVGLDFKEGSQIDYGWAYITINSNYTISLDAVGYDTSGAAATTPTTLPEPSSLLLLVSGAAGIAMYRRKLALRKNRSVMVTAQ
jgi:hypothetical protein